MNDEPRRVLIGVIPSGVDAFSFGEDVRKPLIADASRRLDAEKAEAERLAREGVTVNREFFSQVTYELDRALEVERARAARRGSYDRARAIAGKIRYLREGYAETLARNERGPA
jgi:hypothetical protein